MVSVLLMLAGCASRAPAPAPAPTVLTAEDLELNVAESGPVSRPVASATSALAPILVGREVRQCEPASPLCAAVVCDVANRMSSGFPSRWTFSVEAGDTTVRENLRWIIPPDSQEERVVPLPLAAFMQAGCNATGGVQTSARATACDDAVDCVDVVCSTWTNGSATSTYVDVHLALPDGSRFDHDAVPIEVPANGEISGTVFRFTPDATTWVRGRPAEPEALQLEGHCAYWDGETPLEPLP